MFSCGIKLARTAPSTRGSRITLWGCYGMSKNRMDFASLSEPELRKLHARASLEAVAWIIPGTLVTGLGAWLGDPKMKFAAIIAGVFALYQVIEKVVFVTRAFKEIMKRKLSD